MKSTYYVKIAQSISMNKGLSKMGNQGAHQTDGSGIVFLYPQSLVNADAKIDETQKRILQALVHLKNLQLSQKITTQLPLMLTPNSKTCTDSWAKEDEIDIKNIQHINKCCIYYEDKLRQQQLAYLEARTDLITRLSHQDEQMCNMKERIEHLQKQAQYATSKLKKIESETEHVESYRKNQKERIIQLLIQEKQDIFNKYNIVEKEEMAILQFTHRMEDIIQKKSTDDRDDDVNRIPYIKEIQLEASKIYAALTNPIIQEILNGFTQVVNALHKKIDQIDKKEQSKNFKNEKVNKNLSKMPLLKQKSQDREAISINFDFLHLKQQLSKSRAEYEKRLEEAEKLFNFEKEKCASLKKKVEKYEGQLQKRNKEMQIYQFKQMDASKKIERLEQCLLDYERKLKMQNQQISIFEENRLSLREATIEKDSQDLRQKSKSAYGEGGKSKHSHDSKFQIAAMHTQISKQSHQIEDLKDKIKNVNKILLDKQESLLKNEKKLEDIQSRLKQKKEIIFVKQHQVQRLQVQISEKQEKIQKLLNNLEKQKAKSQKNFKRIQDMESQVCQKNIKMEQYSLSFDQIIADIQKILRKLKGVQISDTEDGQKTVKSKSQQIKKLIKSIESSYDEKLKRSENDLNVIKEEGNLKLSQLEKLKLELQSQRKKSSECTETISKMIKSAERNESELKAAKRELQDLKGIAISQQNNLTLLNIALNQKTEDFDSMISRKQQQQKKTLRYHADYVNEVALQIGNLKQKIEELTQKLIASGEDKRNVENQLQKLSLLLREKEQGADLDGKKWQTINKQYKQQLIRLSKQSQSTEQIMRCELGQKEGELKKMKEYNSEIESKLRAIMCQLEQKNIMIKRNQEELKILADNLEEMREKVEKVSEAKVNGVDSSMENDDNLNQSSQLSIMQSQIRNFKQQLNGLLNAIQAKDKQIQILLAERQKNNQHPTYHEEAQCSEQVKQRLAKTIAQQQKELQRLRTQQTKHEILTKKVEVLQDTLDREKEIYQNQLIKNSKKIFELEDQIRNLRQDVSAKKRKVFSEEYFSIEPSKKFSSNGQTSRNEEASKVKRIKGGKPESHEQISSEVFHSLEEDFVEQVQNRKKQEDQLDNEKINRCRLRREKSQGYDRKLSNERYYDSDQKLKDQKQLKEIDQKVPVELSPAVNSFHEIKNLGGVSLKQNGLKPSQTNLLSHQEVPLVTNSDNSSLNEIIKNLSEENKQLKSLNEVLKKDFQQISEFMQIFDKTWKSEKALENCSESGKLINTQKLIQNLKLLQHSKIKLLQQFNSNDLQTMFDNTSKLIHDTKRWVDLIERLTSLNNKLSLELALLKKCPKFVKTRTLRVGQNDSHHQRSRSVYSEGNVYRQHHVDVDQLPFEMHEDHQHQLAVPLNANQPAPPNSLQILFKENVEMSEISSVKHKSHNSGFLNSKSEIAKMFEKGEKHEKDPKEVKKDENKKDIVDDYLALHQRVDKGERFEKGRYPNMHLYQSASNNKIYHSRVQSNLLQNSPLMQKNTSNYYQETSNMESMYNPKFQLKSNKAKRRAVSKTVSKLSAINSKISEHKKEYAAIIKNIIQKYEDKIAHLQTQFSITVKKIMQNSVPIELFRQLQNHQQNSDTLKLPVKPSTEPPTPNRPVVSNRISQKDEQVEEKIQELETKVERQKKQTEAKDKCIAELKEQIKQAEKKLKQQKAVQQSFKSKYMNEVSHSTHLSSRIEKIGLDFKNFVEKIIINQIRQKRKYKEFGIQVQIQIEQNFSPTHMQNQKRFLKSKKFLPKANSVDSIREGNFGLNTDKNKNISIAETPLTQQNQMMDERKNQKGQLIVEQGKDKKIQKNIKQEMKQEVELSLGRIKSEAAEVKKKQQQLRQSDRSDGEAGKPLTIGAIFNNIMNPNANTLTKKKTISEASKPDQVIYYQSNLKQINKQVQQLLAHYFKEAKIQSEKNVELQDEIFKSKKQRETKTETEKEREREKQKEKQAQKKMKDEEQIRINIKLLESEIIKYKKQASKSIGQREERLKHIVKKIVQAFKISKKSVDKIISDIEKKQANSAKYIDARLFFKNVYSQIKAKEPDQKEEKQVGIKVKKLSSFENQVPQDVQAEGAYEFESYEEKYRALEKLIEKLKADLHAKSQQCIVMKLDHLGIHGDGKKNNSRQHSFVSNQNSQQFEDFEHREFFDNTKPTFELVEELKIELEYYKKKCDEYEAAATRKQTEKVKYIRKW